MKNVKCHLKGKKKKKRSAKFVFFNFLVTGCAAMLLNYRTNSLGHTSNSRDNKH